MQHRLRGARIRGKVLGCPLTTYNPRLPLVGHCVMLLGDAAGLINPLNGEGIQYALQSARWAADTVSERLSTDQLDATSLDGYQRRVHQNLRKDMALSRLIVQIIRNRDLNPVWLRALRAIAARARTDPDYAYRVSCLMIGLVPAVGTPGPSVVVRTVEQAMVSARPTASVRRHGHRGQSVRPALNVAQDRIDATAAKAANPHDLIDWAVEVCRALAEVITQHLQAAWPG